VVTVFDSRADAGRRLAARLQAFHDDGVVLGLPCGGVLVAAEVEIRERYELDRRVEMFGAACSRLSLAERIAIIVDDGIATGATFKVACTVARNRRVRKIVLAVPVAPRGVRQLLGDAADELVCARVVWPFLGIGQEYRDFAKVSEREVLDCLAQTAVPSAGSALNTTPGSEHGRKQQKERFLAAGRDEDRLLLQHRGYG
jgi:predicted phosphoribosyltransferase